MITARRWIVVGAAGIICSGLLGGCSTPHPGDAARAVAPPSSLATAAAATAAPPVASSPAAAPTGIITATAPPPAVMPSTSHLTISATPGPAVITSGSAATPQGAAVGWFTALRTASFEDAPSTWVKRIAAYVTPALETSYRRIAAHGQGGGAGWATFVHDQCRSAVVNVAGVIPPEAPRAAAAAHVQVSATLTTVCRTGTRASTEFIAATVLVIRQHGRWAVAKREF